MKFSMRFPCHGLWRRFFGTASTMILHVSLSEDWSTSSCKSQRTFPSLGRWDFILGGEWYNTHLTQLHVTLSFRTIYPRQAYTRTKTSDHWLLSSECNLMVVLWVFRRLRLKRLWDLRMRMRANEYHSRWEPHSPALRCWSKRPCANALRMVKNLCITWSRAQSLLTICKASAQTRQVFPTYQWWHGRSPPNTRHRSSETVWRTCSVHWYVCLGVNRPGLAKVRACHVLPVIIDMGLCLFSCYTIG